MRAARQLSSRARQLSSAAGGIGTYEAVLPSGEHLKEMNKYSSVITQRKSQGAGQAQLYATEIGKIENGMSKPQIGISSVWYEGNPCNMHLLTVAEEAKKAVAALDMVGLRFNSIGVSDGISNGTDGMAYSLQSRDLIADGIETVMGAQFYDANLSIPGCDKNMPGCIMAMARVNRPAVMVYGGTIRAGCRPDRTDDKLDIISAFEAYGKFVAGTIGDSERLDIVQSACPGPGACGGMYTANTMASSIEALGMSVPYSSSIPAGGTGPLPRVRAAPQRPPRTVCRLAARLRTPERRLGGVEACDGLSSLPQAAPDAEDFPAGHGQASRRGIRRRTRCTPRRSMSASARRRRSSTASSTRSSRATS